jgi:hypothetical protein
LYRQADKKADADRQTWDEREQMQIHRRTGGKWRCRYGKRVKMQTCRCRYKNKGKCR